MLVVIDADGLYMVQQWPDVVKGYQRAVMTPKAVEHGRSRDVLKLDKKANVKESSV